MKNQILSILGCLTTACVLAHAAELPQQHDYQKGLRQWLAGLKAEEFVQPLTPFTSPSLAASDTENYRFWLLSQHAGSIGVSGLCVPPELFTLARIEAPERVCLPPVNGTELAFLSTWTYEGNPYRRARAVQLRAMVPTIVDMLMHDDLHERGDGAANRSDFLGGTLIWLAYNYREAGECLSPAARAAYEEGLKKLVLRLNSWGPRGAMTDMDLFAAVGLRFAADVLKSDAEVQRISQEYSRRLYTEPRFFHPGGYFVDSGAFDVSYNGISLYFAAWAASISDWPFIREAFTKAYRLRSHLTFPEPGGGAYGPSHMSSRTSADSPQDQWGFLHRHAAAGMLTDEALYNVPFPPKSAIESAGARLMADFNAHLKPQDAAMVPWAERHWTQLPNFAYLTCPAGFYERLTELARTNSELLKPATLRSGEEIENFGDALVVARVGGFAAAVHTGPVGGEHREWKRPYGFGGGALSAFWTREAGPLVLGRRRGVQGHVFDTIEEWQSWPTHAVTGRTAAGVFTSARIRQPDLRYQQAGQQAEIEVSGTIPTTGLFQGTTLRGELKYGRRFVIQRSGVQVTSRIASDGADELLELYETIPIFVCPSPASAPAARAVIEFQSGQQWQSATSEVAKNISAVRVKRHAGGCVIRFDQPQSVRLSPADWVDGFQTQVVCRNVLIDLLPGQHEATWRIAPE